MTAAKAWSHHSARCMWQMYIGTRIIPVAIWNSAILDLTIHGILEIYDSIDIVQPLKYDRLISGLLIEDLDQMHYQIF